MRMTAFLRSRAPREERASEALGLLAQPGEALVVGVQLGVAVAVGMFNVPSFTLARAIGGLIAWWWSRRHRRNAVPGQEDGSSSVIIVLASGLILGEGVLSIVNLVLASVGVPHL